MSDIEENNLIFDGISGLSSDSFVGNIRRSMLALGIHKDDELVAAHAAACLRGAALDWYEELPNETQDSWKMLRKAILARWPGVASIATPTTDYSAIGVASITSIPTPPAAAPAPQPLTNLVPQSRTGRIEVIQGGAIVGYVSKDLNSRGHHKVVPSQEDAAVVQLAPAHRGIQILLLPASPGGPARLGITAFELASPKHRYSVALSRQNLVWGGLASISSPLDASPSHSTSSLNGTSLAKVWNIDMDGTLNLAWLVEPRTRYDVFTMAVVDTKALAFCNDQAKYAGDPICPQAVDTKLVFRPM